MKTWYTAAELVGTPELPTRSYDIVRRAKRENWASRPRAGKGGGSEYHISDLPEATRNQLMRASAKADAKAREQDPNYCREALWYRFEKASNKDKAEAARRVQALDRIEQLIAEGNSKSDAWLIGTAEYGWGSPSTLRRLAKGVYCFNRQDWLAALCPVSAKITHGSVKSRIDSCAWDSLLADYLRLEQPAAKECIRRVQALAKEHGWELPSFRTLQRRLEGVPRQIKTLRRGGEHALARLYPSQERSVSHLSALDIINADGYTFNVFVKWYDGRTLRPKIWAWQDIYSRKIISYAIGTSENKELIRLSFGRVLEQYGVPREVVIDNTRAAANKDLSGGIQRRRHKRIDDEPLGLFGILGIKVHWTTIVGGKGWGQAKPIERAFRDFGELIDKHPAFAGAYTGANPMAKPDNYASSAVPAKSFESVVESLIAEYNSRAGRRTEACAGNLSFEQAFNQSYTQAAIRFCSDQQRELWLLATEPVKVSRTGTVQLKASMLDGAGANTYYDEALLPYVGQQVVARYDPHHMHSGVVIYSLDGVRICAAACWSKVGFNDANAARDRQTAKRNWIKATKQQAEALQRMRDLSTLQGAFIGAKGPAQQAATPMPATHEMLIRQPRAPEEPQESIIAQYLPTGQDEQELDVNEALAKGLAALG